MSSLRRRPTRDNSIDDQDNLVVYINAGDDEEEGFAAGGGEEEEIPVVSNIKKINELNGSNGNNSNGTSLGVSFLEDTLIVSAPSSTTTSTPDSGNSSKTTSPSRIHPQSILKKKGSFDSNNGSYSQHRSRSSSGHNSSNSCSFILSSSPPSSSGIHPILKRNSVGAEIAMTLSSSSSTGNSSSGHSSVSTSSSSQVHPILKKSSSEDKQSWWREEPILPTSTATTSSPSSSSCSPSTSSCHIRPILKKKSNSSEDGALTGSIGLGVNGSNLPSPGDGSSSGQQIKPILKRKDIWSKSSQESLLFFKDNSQETSTPPAPKPIIKSKSLSSDDPPNEREGYYNHLHFINSQSDGSKSDSDGIKVVTQEDIEEGLKRNPVLSRAISTPNTFLPLTPRRRSSHPASLEDSSVTFSRDQQQHYSHFATAHHHHHHPHVVHFGNSSNSSHSGSYGHYHHHPHHHPYHTVHSSTNYHSSTTSSSSSYPQSLQAFLLARSEARSNNHNKESRGQRDSLSSFFSPLRSTRSSSGDRGITLSDAMSLESRTSTTSPLPVSSLVASNLFASKDRDDESGNQHLNLCDEGSGEGHHHLTHHHKHLPHTFVDEFDKKLSLMVQASSNASSCSSSTIEGTLSASVSSVTDSLEGASSTEESEETNGQDVHHKIQGQEEAEEEEEDLGSWADRAKKWNAK